MPLIDAFLAFQKQLLDWLISIRPVVNFTIPPGISTFVSAVYQWDWVFPVHEITISISVLLGAFLVLTGWKWTLQIVTWIADIIP